MLIYPSLSSAQNHVEHDSKEARKHHRVAIMISHTHIPKGVHSVHTNAGLIVPSWGFNYEYWFNTKWALGMHNAMDITTYIIEDENGEDLVRERPIIVSLVGIYNPWKGLELVMGAGREVEESNKFWVYRIGLEYEIEIGAHWDIAPGLIFDIKEDIYSSWSVGMSVGKRF